MSGAGRWHLSREPVRVSGLAEARRFLLGGGETVVTVGGGRFLVQFPPPRRVGDPRFRHRTGRGPLGSEVVDRFLVASADANEVAGEIAGLGIALFDESGEVTAMAADGEGELIQGLEQFEDIGELLVGEGVIVPEVFEADILDAELDEDPVQLGDRLRRTPRVRVG